MAAGVSIAAPALPLYAKSFNVDFGTASTVLIVNQLGGMMATMPTGYLTDRFGGRKMVILGPIITGVASLLMAFAHSFPELLVYRFIEGWGMQMWQIGRLEIITVTGGERRGTQITGMFGMDTAGRLMGPALGGFVAAVFGLRAPFLLYGIVAFVTIVPSFFLVPNIAGSKSPAARAAGTAVQAVAVAGGRLRQTWATYAALLTVPVLLLLTAQFLASMTRGSLFGGTLDLYAVYAYGVGPETVGLLAAAGAGLGLPLTFMSGRLMDRFGRRAIIAPGFCFLAVALMVMSTSAFGHWTFSSYVASFLFARFAMSSVSGCMQVIGSDLAPPHARGTFFGLWGLMRNIGSFLSPAVFAVMAQGLGFGASFALLSVMSLGTAGILNSQLKTAKRPRPAIVAVA
ncbi:MAG: MFS transporter [Chloroflexota bacterium]